MIFLSTLLISVLLTALMIPLLSGLALRFNLVDVPNERKVHTRPIPRVGGLAMTVGAFVPIAYWCRGEKFVMAYLAGAGVLVLFGLLDDFTDLSPRWKLVGQITAALIMVYGGGLRISNVGMLAPDGYLLPVWFGVPFTVLSIVGVTNAINLSDGLDGLAGGISLLSLCCISYLAYLDGDITIALIGLSLCGAIFGFLRYNSYPATIFMGDVGSQLLGYTAITLALSLTQGNTALSPALPFLILGFPVLDTLTVMTGRIVRRRSPFSADKTHFHHCLLALKLHQSESVMVIYTIQVSLILTAFLLRFHSDWLLLGGYLGFSGTVLATFYISRRHNWEPERLVPLERLKAAVRHLRDETDFIKYLFLTLKGGMLTVLILTMLSTARIPGYISLGALAGIVGLAWVYFLWPRFLEDYLRVVLYLLIPAGIYFSSIRMEKAPNELPVQLYHLLFALLALLNVLVSKLTRRKQGFKSTPLDFLILFLALVVPNLPESNMREYHLGMIAAKIIICYFSCEVILAELRGKFQRVALATLVALALMVVRGV
jgi:UDP-GlcNAc:undecaprenyl-phosphate GlcNAc-1-phosphate transferase